MTKILRFIETNAGSSELRNNKTWLIVGSCILEENKNELENIQADIILYVCPEEIHMNMIETKLAAMIKISKPQKIKIMTKDGSPHCIQLHYVGEDILKYFGCDITIEHYVVHKKKIIKINQESVRTSRYLYKVDQLLKREKK